MALSIDPRVIAGAAIRHLQTARGPQALVNALAEGVRAALAATSGGGVASVTGDAEITATPTVGSVVLAIASLAASKIAGVLDPAVLPATVPLTDQPNQFSNLQAIRQDVAGAGASYTPTPLFRLENGAVTTGDGTASDSPAVFWRGRAFMAWPSWNSAHKDVPVDWAAYLRMISGNYGGSFLDITTRFNDETWSRFMSMFRGGPQGGGDNVIFWYRINANGGIGLGSGAGYQIRSSGNGDVTVVQRESGTDNLLLSSTAVGGAVKARDTGNAAVPVDAANTVVGVVVSGTSQTMSSRCSYQVTNAALTTLTLPAAAAVGEQIAVRGTGVAGWKIVQGAGQQICAPGGNTTAGAGGYLSSASAWDAVTIECVAANTKWAIVAVVGAPVPT